MASVKRRFGTEPADQLHEIAVTAVVLEWLAIVRRGLALDNEFALPARIKASEDLHEFGINRNVIFRLPALGPKIFGRLDVDHVLIEAERSPWELVDLVPAKASHRAQQKDFELFGLQAGQLCSRAFQKDLHVEA